MALNCWERSRSYQLRYPYYQHRYLSYHTALMIGFHQAIGEAEGGLESDRETEKGGREEAGWQGETDGRNEK